MNAHLDAEVRSRAADRCEYCLLPQAAFKRRFHIEHIVARQHGGQSSLENLALACWFCNFQKGPNLSGVDPETEQPVLLFNPREQRWTEHFHASPARSSEMHSYPGLAIVGRTAVGRATVHLLEMNDAFRSILRANLANEGFEVGR